MSGASQSGAGRREVAYRLFAAEFEDAELEHSESEEERAPNYVITPAGARVNRLFVVGVLTEVEEVSEDVLRGRVVDPTGAFVVYAGQYQPDAQTFLERAEPPMFVAVTGKARTFRPDGSDRVLTSVRPESINEVDADTRDRWTVQAAEHTMDRVAAFAAALERPERGDELREALLDAGVDYGLASGIPLAIEHYGTTTAYLAAVREMAIEAAEVVAGEREEVSPLEVGPEEGGEASVPAADLDAEAAETAGAAGPATSEAEATPGGEPTPATETSTDVAGEEAEPGPEIEAEGEPENAAGVETESGATTPAGEGEELGDFDDFGDEEPGVETEEMYELDEGERAAIEEEYGTDFETGTEVDEPGEADIETPDEPTTGDEPESEAETEPETGTAPDVESEPASEPEPEVETEPESKAEDETEGEGEGPEDEAPETEAPGTEVEAEAGEPEGDEASAEAADVDLEDAAVEAMRELDSGDGAEQAAVIDAVAEEHGADPEAIEEAIQDALMSGKCYEPGEGLLKAI